MKGRRVLLECDCTGEDEGAEDAARALNEERFLYDEDAETDSLRGDDHLVNFSDTDFDMLSDLDSEATESEWEFVDAALG